MKWSEKPCKEKTVVGKFCPQGLQTLALKVFSFFFRTKLQRKKRTVEMKSGRKNQCKGKTVVGKFCRKCQFSDHWFFRPLFEYCMLYLVYIRYMWYLYMWYLYMWCIRCIWCMDIISVGRTFIYSTYWDLFEF